MSGIGDIRKACDALSGLLLARRSDALRVASALRRLMTVKLGDAYGWRLEVRGQKVNAALIEDDADHRDAILEQSESIDRVLHAAWKRLPKNEGVDLRTPDEDLMAAEDFRDALREEFGGERVETFHRLMNFFFGGGSRRAHPCEVLRRLYAVAYALRPDLILHMGDRDIGMMFGETPAAVSWRMHRIFDGKLHVRSAKREESRGSYREASMGNNNRRNGTMRKEHGDG
jgi:hypothetical protein